MTPRNLTIRRQSGAALALSLMMMAVLTLLAVASMNSTLLEMLMAGNLQFQTRSLINAENTLVVAEETAKTLNPLTDYNTTGRSTISTDGAKDPLTMAWKGAVGGGGGGTGSTGDSLQNGSPGDRYILEYAGSQTVTGSSASWDAGGGAPNEVQIIRVTAHSEGTKGAVRTVQSVYIMKIP